MTIETQTQNAGSRHRAAAGGLAMPPVAGYRPAAVWVAILMVSIIAVRLHEIIPYVGILRPALLVSVGGTAFLLAHTRPAALHSSLRDPIFRRVLLYVGWCCVTVPFALWKGAAATAVQGLVPATLLTLGVLLCAPTKANLDRIEIGLVVTSSLFAVCLLALGSAVVDDRLSISSSLDSNDVAAVMALSLPFAAGQVLHGGTRRRLLGLGAAGLMGMAVIASGSRGGAIALVVGVLVFVLGLRGPRKVMMLAVFFAAGSIGWITASATFRERIVSIASPEEDYNYTDYMGRWQVWGRALGYTLHYPLFGVGIANFPVAEGETLAALKTRGKWSTTHNSFLQASSELGLPGGILFISIFWLAGRTAGRIWQRRRRAGWLHRPQYLAGLLAFAASAFFLSHAYFYAFFGLLGMIALAHRVALVEGQAAQPLMAPRAAPATVVGRRSARAASGPVVPAYAPDMGRAE